MAGLSAAPLRDVLVLAYAAAVATAAADTCSSEVGKAFGRRTFLITTLRPVPPGTEGAISVEGTLGGLLGAALVAALGALLGLYGATAAALVALAGLARQPRGERPRHRGREAGLAGQRPAECAQHRDRRASSAVVLRRCPRRRRGPVDRPPKAKAYVELARPFTLLPPALGVLSGAITAWGAGHSRPPVTSEPPPARRLGNADGRRPERRQQRDQPDLRPRHRPGEQAEAPASERGPDDLREAWVFTAGHRGRGLGPRLARLARRPPRVLLDRGLHDLPLLDLLGPSPLDEAPRLPRQHHDRHPPGRAPEGGGLVHGQDDRRARALVHRLDLRPLPAGRREHQGLRGHRGRPRGRLQDPAHPLRGEGGGLDHRALLRPSRSS